MPTTTARRTSTEQRFLLEAADWLTYRRILEALGDRHVFVTYDRGRLELMSPSPEHETYKGLVRRLIETLALELDVDIRSGGSTTFNREDLDRGLEPDECYWIRNEPLVWDHLEVDLTRDPPPDLAIEIDVTSSSINRQALYAALGVPELWRYDGTRLSVLLLDPDGRYCPAERSASFPFLPMQEFAQFLATDPPLKENERVRRFRDWVRRLPPMK
ncbi:MAG: Uma2 family endonuclease [Planctomycetes bacterium]|nr:Uma2 family endonuclease [Planctomycetota bacterium]